MLVAAARKDRVVAARLIVHTAVSALTVPSLRPELLEDAVSAIGRATLIGKRIEEVHHLLRHRIDAIGRDDLARERLTRERILRRDRRGAEVAIPHGLRRHGCAAAAVDRLVVRTFVVAEEEQLAADERTAEAAAPPVVVRLRQRVAALDARQRLVVGQCVEAVVVEVVEGAAMKGIAAALRCDDDAGKAAVLGAERVRQHLDFLDRIETGRRIADRAEDGVGRGLPVLDVRDAVGLRAQELDVGVAAADDVRVEQEERLDVARVARQVAQLLGIEAARDRAAVERDVVLRVGRDRDGLAHAADFERDIDERGRRRAHHDASSLELLEARGQDFDLVRAWLKVGRLVAAFRVRIDRAWDAGGFVGDEHRGLRHRAA